MKDTKSKMLAVLGIIAVIFTVIMFVIPFAKTGVLFTGYIFGLIAIAAQVYVFASAGKNGESPKSRFYGFPIVKIGVTYMVTQLIVSLIEAGFAWIMPTWLAVVIDVIICGIAIIGLIGVETARDEVTRQDVNLKINASDMRELQSMAAALASRSGDDKVKKLAEKFRYSDPVSNERTQEAEMNISAMLVNLQKAVNSGDSEDVDELVGKIDEALDERNRSCRLSKY